MSSITTPKHCFPARVLDVAKHSTALIFFSGIRRDSMSPGLLEGQSLTSVVVSSIAQQRSILDT